MRLVRRPSKDRVGAVVLILGGLGIVVQGQSYHMGTLTHMRAGFMPVVLGTILTVIGIAIGITAEPRAVASSHAVRVEWRGWLCILGGVIAFVVFGTYGGLVPATFAAVFISALGDRGNTVLGAAILALCLVAIGVAIFSFALRLQLPLFSWG